MKTVKIGLIGFGFMGTTHWGVYKGMKNVKVTALADVDPVKRTGDISKVVGNIGGGDNSKPIDLSGVKTYSDGFELIQGADVDIIDICVPTPDHARLAMAALRSGKHVFCEKPLCRTQKQAEKIIAAARSAKGYFNVGLCVRAWPEYRHAYEYFKSGKAGKLYYATFKRFSPSVAGNSWKDWYMDGEASGGALLDLHIHDADEVNYFFGKPQSLEARGINVVSRGAIDHVVCNYEYGDGRFVVAEGGWIASKGTPFEMSFTIVCEKATLKFDASGYHIYPVAGKIISPKCNIKAGLTGWHQELAYFVDCVRKGVKPEKYQTLDSIADSMAIVFAEEKSIKTRRTITL